MTQKWSTEQIVALIDAYQEEPCLYATNTPNYHNKNLRAEALNRITNAVSRLRPTVTPKECSNKFHNLRNQFNIEHSKVKTSLKSGTGTDDVYKPSLWYYEKLLFLESFVAPRKSRNSMQREAVQSDLTLSQSTVPYTMEENSKDTDMYRNVEYVDEILVSEPGQISSAEEDLPGNSSAELLDVIPPQRLQASSSVPHGDHSALMSSVSTNVQQGDLIFPRPSASPVLSTTSTSGVCTPRRRKKKKYRSETSSDEFSHTLNNFLDSMKNPMTVNLATQQSNSKPDLIDGFVMFIGSLLRGFQDEELKLEVINRVIQLIMNAKTTDSQRSKS